MRANGEWRFLFDLTLALGYPHPRYLQQHLTSNDITDWMEYAKAYPLPGARMSYMLGTIAAMLFNTNKGKEQPYRNWDDFFPTMDSEIMQSQKSRPKTKAEKDAEANFVVNAFTAYNQRVTKKG